MKTGTFLEFKRFAVHDGPGIRTTLFLKGCPLRCVWCHNPESLTPSPELGYFAAKCSHCGRCAAVCPLHEITRGEHLFHRETCRNCGHCAAVCPREALVLYGREITPETAAAKIAEDLPFYEISGGGATLSGGEPLQQPEFCAELLKLLRANGIHTALDTCGAFPFERFEMVLPWVNLVLYDLKGMNSARHRTNTGMDNTRILDNLRRLDAANVPLEIRMPLIPGRNDSREELLTARDFLTSLRGPVRIRLLAFHDLSRGKYAALSRHFPMDSPERPAELSCAAELLRDAGLDVIG